MCQKSPMLAARETSSTCRVPPTFVRHGSSLRSLPMNCSEAALCTMRLHDRRSQLSCSSARPHCSALRSPSSTTGRGKRRPRYCSSRCNSVSIRSRPEAFAPGRTSTASATCASRRSAINWLPSSPVAPVRSVCVMRPSCCPSMPLGTFVARGQSCSPCPCRRGVESTPIPLNREPLQGIFRQTSSRQRCVVPARQKLPPTRRDQVRRIGKGGSLQRRRAGSGGWWHAWDAGDPRTTERAMPRSSPPQGVGTKKPAFQRV